MPTFQYGNRPRESTPPIRFFVYQLQNGNQPVHAVNDTNPFCAGICFGPRLFLRYSGRLEVVNQASPVRSCESNNYRASDPAVIPISSASFPPAPTPICLTLQLNKALSRTTPDRTIPRMFVRGMKARGSTVVFVDPSMISKNTAFTTSAFASFSEAPPPFLRPLHRDTMTVLRQCHFSANLMMNHSGTSP